MTLSFCISPISSGKDSSLLEWRNSTVAFFQLPICEGKDTEPLANKMSRLACTQFNTFFNLYKHIYNLMCILTSGGSWVRKLWSAAKVRMLTHWPMKEGKASISLKLQSSSSRDVSLMQREAGRIHSYGVITIYKHSTFYVKQDLISFKELKGILEWLCSAIPQSWETWEKQITFSLVGTFSP